MILNYSFSAVPDFKKLYKISRVLEEGSVFAQCLNLISDKTEISRIMDELIQHEHFTHAKECADLVRISKDTLLGGMKQTCHKSPNYSTLSLIMCIVLFCFEDYS